MLTTCRVGNIQTKFTVQTVYTRLPRSGKLMVAHAAAKQIIPNRGQEAVVGNVPAKGARMLPSRAAVSQMGRTTTRSASEKVSARTK